jgi:hypothetical protein
VPTATPYNSNDTIPAGGVPSAVRGRDHLNNVEVVDVDAPVSAGVWQIKVIGFSMSPYSQPFSLVGHEFHDATIPPKFCQMHKQDVCGAFWEEGIFAYKLDPPGNQISGKFPPSEQKNIVRLTTLCKLGFTCPPCATNGRCPEYHIRFEEMATPLQIEVYTFQGELVARDTSAKLAKTISFKARPKDEYLLVWSPARRTMVEKEYEVKLQITE